MFDRLRVVLFVVALASSADAQLSVVQSGAVVTSSAARRAPVAYDFPDAGVRVTAWSAWPDMLYQGYQPIVFEFENKSADERVVEIELTRGWSDDRWRVRETATVAGGARERVELFAPVSRIYDSDYTARLACGGESTHLNGLGANQQANHAVWPVLYAHGPERAPAAGMPEVWGAALSAHPPQGLPEVSPQEDANLRRFRSMGYVGPLPPTGPPAPAAWSVAVTPIDLDELPARFEPYTSLKAVILDAQSPPPRPEVLEALLAWTRLGGCVVFQGPDAEARARAVPAAAAWMEERFVQSESDGDRVYACGQGALVVCAQYDLQGLRTSGEEAPFNATLDLVGRGMARAVSFAGAPQSDAKLDALPGLSGLELPYRALTLLLVLFAIVIGPVNLIVVKRLNRPALLLVTVPVIALVFSLGLFVYGAIAQGLGTRARGRALTWLDQRNHVASTLEVRSLFAGMPAANGWKPGPGVACVALPTDAGHTSTGQLALDFREGLVYTGDYLPVRREVRSAFLADRAARARLEVTRNGERITVENGLGAPIEGLVLRDADGAWHVLSARLGVGGKAELEPVALANTAVERVEELLGELAPLASSAQPFAGAYVARLGGSAFTDACGVEYEEEESAHVVFGILDATLGGKR
ncbi:MAG: hypothetical protein HZA53_12265 [Planctomycetes bacterium]|nr:hypothetical protein [Planctomycetota bacterium]